MAKQKTINDFLQDREIPQDYTILLAKRDPKGGRKNHKPIKLKKLLEDYYEFKKSQEA